MALEKKHARLAAIGLDPQVELRVTLSRIYQETDRYVDDLAQSVRECKRVDEAARWVRWFEMSGIMRLLTANSPSLSSLTPALSVSVLQRKLRDLIFDCGELFKGGKANARYAESDIAEINRKLDLLLNPSSLTGHPSSLNRSGILLPDARGDSGQ